MNHATPQETPLCQDSSEERDVEPKKGAGVQFLWKAPEGFGQCLCQHIDPNLIAQEITLEKEILWNYIDQQAKEAPAQAIQEEGEG